MGRIEDLDISFDSYSIINVSDIYCKKYGRSFYATMANERQCAQIQ